MTAVLVDGRLRCERCQQRARFDLVDGRHLCKPCQRAVALKDTVLEAMDETLGQSVHDIAVQALLSEEQVRRALRDLVDQSRVRPVEVREGHSRGRKQTRWVKS